MTPPSNQHHALRAWAPRAIVTATIGALWALSQYPGVDPGTRQELASRFRFVRTPLPEAEGRPRQQLRAMHPELAHVAGWMSTMGASVALADLDGDGVANDLCHIDTRTDTVMIAPAPGTGDRYPARVLDPAPLPYAAATMCPLVCVPSDMNEDGAQDLLVTYWGRSPIAFLRHGDGYVARELVEPHEIWNTGAVSTADLDGDGHVDLIVGNYFPDGMPLLDAGSTAPLGALQTSMSRAYNGGRTHVLRWVGAAAGPDPAVRYERVQALDPEVERGWTLAIGARDLDGDLLPELYLAHDFGPDRLLHNRSTPGTIAFARLEGERRFTSARSKVVGQDSFKGMGVDFGDLDGDGRDDIFVSNLTSNALQENHFAWIGAGDPAAMKEGRAPFIDRGDEIGVAHSGWAWDAKIADFDNDGAAELVQTVGFLKGQVSRWPELEELAMENDGLLGVPTTWPRFGAGDDLSGAEVMPFYVRHQGRFVDIARELDLAQPGVTRGIAVADVDADGDLDYAIANQWDTSWMIRNECPKCGAFLGLHLRLPLAPAPLAVRDGHPVGGAPTRPAIGAQATLTLADGRRLHAEVDGGNGHSGKRSPDLHFGLGDLSPGARLPVELRWRDPDGKTHAKTIELAPGWHTVELEWTK